MLCIRVLSGHIVVAIFFLAFTMTKSAHACACCGTYKVINVKSNDQLSVRKGPGQKFKTIAWLHPDESCINKTSVCEGEWCQIEFGTIKGWVNTYYLALVEHTAPAKKPQNHTLRRFRPGKTPGKQ